MQYANSPYAKKNARMTKWIFAVVVAGAVIFLGFQAYVYVEQTRDRRDVWRGKQQVILPSNWELSLKLYKKLASSDPGSNIVFSPLVLSMVVADLAQEVSLNSSRQILKAMNWDMSTTEDFQEMMLQINHRYSRIYENKNTGDTVEKSISLSKGINLHSKRLNNRNLHNDHIQETSTARNETAGISMRSFVTNATDNHIQGSSKSRLYQNYAIVSSVLCDRPPKMNDNKSNIYPEEFHISKNKTVLLPMIHRVGFYRTVDADDLRCKLIELPGPTSDINLYLFVPRGDVKVDDVGSKLSRSVLRENLPKSTKRKTEVHLPLFEVSQSLQISDLLSYLGLPELFHDNVTKIRGKPPIVSNNWTFQRSFVHFDQAPHSQTDTVANFNDTEEKQQLFLANRPFLFVAYDDKTDTILFMGKYIGSI